MGKAADAGKAVELSALLVAIDRAELSVAEWEVFIGSRFGAVDFAVVRAVHRFEEVLLALDRGVDWLEAVFAVLGVVA